MPVKVTVVIPVYNPGSYIDPCIASILGQSLPPDEFEAIFVDDGSTDETPALLDALDADHPNISVIHQENSGWPGKPRNVGIDAAQGEYVFFLDHDDALGPEALERLYAMAVRNDADIVIGKMAGHGRRVPKDLFLESRDRATLADAPLLDSLTPHKLFRRSFIERHALRYPEGRRRLEDHVFVVRAYFLASVISILSDYVCYYHTWRDDMANAGHQRLDPVGYYTNVREVIGIVESFTEPGSFRDSLLQRFARVELLGRLRDRGFLEHPPEYREALFAEIGAVVEEHIPPTVDPLLAPAQRVQMALVRAGRLDLLLILAAAQEQVKGVARLVRIDATKHGTLHVVVRAHLEAGDDAFGVGPLGDRLALEVPEEVAAVVSPEAIEIPAPLSGSARMVIRRRADSAELVVPASIEQVVDVGPKGDLRPSWVLESEIDPMTIASGAPVWPGAWELVVRMSVAGYTKEPHVRLDDAEPYDDRKTVLHGTGSLSVFAYWSESRRRLTLLVRTVAGHREFMRPTRRLGRLLRRLRDRVRSTQHERGTPSPR
jgi:glycosyltransferase involved in cell wall biosynthesis